MTHEPVVTLLELTDAIRAAAHGVDPGTYEEAVANVRRDWQGDTIFVCVSPPRGGATALQLIATLSQAIAKTAAKEIEPQEIAMATAIGMLVAAFDIEPKEKAMSFAFRAVAAAFGVEAELLVAPQEKQA